MGRAGPGPAASTRAHDHLPRRLTALAAIGGALIAASLPRNVGVVLSGVLHVDRDSTSCSHNGSGTIGRPFCTIGAAARIVDAGQTMQVASGVFREEIAISASGTSTAPIVFKAAPGAAVTLSGGANGFVIVDGRWITVSGFNITH